MQQRKPLSFILVKPSGPDCNLGCSYCFYTRKATYFGEKDQHRMSESTLERLMQKSLQRPGEHMAFGWQGGEPTLMGLDFYKRVIALQKTYGNSMQISNSFQTNGILIDDAWASFFTQYNFLVGLSIDGPAHIHDQYRVHRGGQPTHAEVERAATLMLNADVAVNALSVVTEYSASHAQQIYSYLKDLGFTYMQFIPILEMDENNPRKVADYSVTAESYGKFLCDMFDLWEADFVDGKPTTSIRQFETYAAIYLGYPSPECTTRRSCGDYLVVEHNGEIYSCDFFVEDAWKLGTIFEDKSLHEMLNGRRQTLFGEVKTKLDKRCINCPWLQFCYGGCPKDRLRNPVTKRFNPFCQSTKMFFTYADERFRALLAGLPR